MIASPFVTVTLPVTTSTVTILSVPTVAAVPLTLTVLPEAAVVPPNTSVSFPFDGALNVILVLPSILRHLSYVTLLYVTEPLLSDVLPVIVKKSLVKPLLKSFV